MEQNKENNEKWHRITSIRETPYHCNKHNEIIVKALNSDKDEKTCYFQIHRNRKSLVEAVKGLFENSSVGKVYWAYIQEFNK